MAQDRVQVAVDTLIDAIADKTFTPDKPLPAEAELASFLEVSRPTMREAVRILSSKGVLNVVHGRGTFVAPPDQWHDVATILSVLLRWTSPRELGLQLVEIRRMIEVGATGLAARNRTEDDLTAMQQCLDDYLKAEKDGDLHAIVEADIAFHDCIIKASKNPFLPSVLDPLKEALYSSRTTTSSKKSVRNDAKFHHNKIFTAIKAKDEKAAKEAMRAHMTQTKDAFIAMGTNATP